MRTECSLVRSYVKSWNDFSDPFWIDLNWRICSSDSVAAELRNNLPFQDWVFALSMRWFNWLSVFQWSEELGLNHLTEKLSLRAPFKYTSKSQNMFLLGCCKCTLPRMNFFTYQYVRLHRVDFSGSVMLLKKGWVVST